MDIKALLRKRHNPYDWATGSEVELDGWHKLEGGERHVISRVDFVAVNIKLGREASEIFGYEIKVTRADFLAELRQPNKRLNIEQACHRVYFIAPSGIIDPNELPERWGLVEVTGDRLRTRVSSKPRSDTKPVQLLGVVMRQCLRYPERHGRIDP